ncbi:MAG: serpin family protein, partial [Terracidiphilus sp.]
MKPLLCAFLAITACGATLAAQQPPAHPTAPAADQAQAVRGSNQFAVDLYAHLRAQPGNLFFSPESISTAFAMTYAGASGETASQMANVFHFTLPPDRLHPAMGALLSQMNSAHAGYELHVADALWAQQDESFRQSFLTLVRSDYGAGFHQVDFRTSPEAVRGDINRWIERETNDKIRDMLGPGTVTPITRLVLTNAIYFKGSWVNQFNHSATRPDAFHVTSSESVQAPFMHRTGGYQYLDGGSFQAIELPYQGNDLSMVILLPKQIDGLPALEQSFTATALGQWMQNFHFEDRVILSLPRFTLTRQFELSRTLAAMGMPQAFTNQADFSGMSANSGLKISAAIHKAFVDVNETGTEAAAATSTILTAAAAMRMEAPPIVFNADHP